MNENINAQNIDNGLEAEGDRGIVWLLKGFVFPSWNGAFYKKAVGKSVGLAVVFLFIFAVVLSIVVAYQSIISLSLVGKEIKESYEKGEFPTITIEDGIASTDINKPFIFSSGRQIITIDTTGRTKEIDTKAYSEGLLLTRTDVHFVNEDGYRVMPLSDLNEAFGNPIVIDKVQALKFWNWYTLGFGIITVVGAFLWYSFARLAYLAMIGVIIWGIVSITRRGVGFDVIIITGIYASVPATYLVFILNRVGIDFFAIFTVLLIAIWAIACNYVIKAQDKGMNKINSGAV